MCPCLLNDEIEDLAQADVFSLGIYMYMYMYMYYLLMHLLPFESLK